MPDDHVSTHQAEDDARNDSILIWVNGKLLPRAQATVSVRLEEEGRVATGQAADTDTILASVKAYVGALNRLRERRQKTAPDADVKAVTYASP